MIAVTFNGSPAYLLDDVPDWNGSLTLDAEIPTHNERGISGRETRRQLGDTLRLSLRYTTLLQDSAVPYFRNALQDLNTQRVLCPLWVYPFAAAATPGVVTAFCVLMGDGAAPAIVPYGSVAAANRPGYPLMVGRLSDLPDPGALTDTVVSVEINFTEGDTFTVTPPAFTPTNALTAANGTRPIFPWRANWATVPGSGSAEVDLDRRNIGQLRQTSDSYFSQRSRRNIRQSFTLQVSEPWQLLRFFLDIGATRQNFWLPASISEARLTANVSASDTALNVDNPSARGNNTFVVLDDLTNRVPLTITGTSGSQWNISGTVGTAFTASQTRIESLMLARFDTTKISLRWLNLLVVDAQVSFKEVPWETAAVSGETIGSTMGPLPTCAYLYKFTVNYPGSTQTWYFTSFERDLDTGGNTYVSTGIEHDTITETAALERQSVSLKSRIFSGNPLGLMIPFQLEWPLLIDIYEADASGNTATNLRTLFSGEVSKCDSEGPFINATATSLSSIFDRKIPRRLLQPSCNWMLFEPSPGCGLSQAAWEWVGAVSSFSPSTMTLALTGVASTASNPASLVAHFFAGGFLRVGAGSAAQYRLIADSTVLAGGGLTLVLASPFTTAPANGALAFFYPGCDGNAQTCQTKFNNFARFGGFPFMPVGNPSAIKVSQNVSGGGKK